MSKYEKLQVKTVYLWTFGSRLKGTFWFFLFNDIWRRFTIRMSTYCKRESLLWAPTFRVYETGSRGGRVHCHVIFTERFPHERAIFEWRKLVPEANVNVSSSYSNKSVFDSVMYCVKYLLKDGTRNYSVMGKLLKKLPRVLFPCKICITQNPKMF